MTIISCQELDLEGARSYEESLSEGVIGKRTFLVISDSDTEFEQFVLSEASGVGPDALPRAFENWPGNPFCLCWKRTPTRNRMDKTKWLVTCEYKTIFNQLEIDRSTQDDPTKRPTRISGQSRTILVPVRFMLRTVPYQTWSNGIAFTMCTAANSASDPLDPPVDQPQTEWELHCEKHVLGLPAWFGANSGYSDGVNANDQVITVQGQTFAMQQGTAKLSNFTFSDHKQENGYSFITIGWNVTFRKPRQPIGGEQSVPGPWDVERLDEGMRTRSQIAATANAPASAQWLNVKDKSGQAITTPVPFNGFGLPITDPGVAIPESKLTKYCYRPCGLRVDYSVIPWA